MNIIFFVVPDYGNSDFGQVFKKRETCVLRFDGKRFGKLYGFLASDAVRIFYGFYGKSSHCCGSSIRGYLCYRFAEYGTV